MGGVNWQEQIPFNAWRAAMMDTFSDVIQSFNHHNAGIERLSQSEYEQTNIIVNVLKNDKQMLDIFFKLSGGKDYMTMPQYVSVMSQLQMQRQNLIMATTKFFEANQELPPVTVKPS